MKKGETFQRNYLQFHISARFPDMNLVRLLSPAKLQGSFPFSHRMVSTCWKFLLHYGPHHVIES